MLVGCVYGVGVSRILIILNQLQQLFSFLEYKHRRPFPFGICRRSRTGMFVAWIWISILGWAALAPYNYYTLIANSPLLVAQCWGCTCTPESCTFWHRVLIPLHFCYGALFPGSSSPLHTWILNAELCVQKNEPGKDRESLGMRCSSLDDSNCPLA